MKKQEFRLLDSFVRHIDAVFKAMPCLPSDIYRPRTVNAWRLAKKELARLKKIMEEKKDD